LRSPAVDAEPLDQPRETEARGDHPDRSQERGFLGVDLVAGERQPVPARRRDILGEGKDRDVLLLRELADAAVEQCGLHRRPARRVYRQGYRVQPTRPKRPVERGGVAAERQRAAPLSRPDRPLEAHHRHDRRWIAKALDRQQLQGILEGHNIPQMGIRRAGGQTARRFALLQD
jgi:hypothetical protein